MAIINNQKAFVNVLQFDINALPEDISPSLQYDYTVIYDSSSDELRKVALSNMVVGGGASLAHTATQTAHGFSIGDVINNNGTFAKAKADTATNAEVIGIVSGITDVNTFTYISAGYISGLSGISAGTRYYLSDSVAGLYTATEPTTTGHVSKPVLLGDSTTGGVVIASMRGKVL